MFKTFALALSTVIAATAFAAPSIARDGHRDGHRMHDRGHHHHGGHRHHRRGGLAIGIGEDGIYINKRRKHRHHHHHRRHRHHHHD